MASGNTGLVVSLACAWVVFLFAGCEPDAAKQKGKHEQANSEPVKIDINSAMEAAKLLDEALDAQFSLERLKAAQQWTARSSGTYMGMPYSGITTFNGESMRMDIQMPGGGQMSFVAGGKYCWSKTGPVVTTCPAADRKAYKEQFIWENAARLYPLKQEGWVLKKDEATIDGKVYPSLVISNRSLEGKGTLIFDPRAKLLAKSQLPMVFNGQKGQMSTDFSDYRQECGVMMPFHTISTFEGKKVAEDKVDEYYCDPVEADLFPQPLQVADGTFSLYTTSAQTAFCLNFTGTYSDLDPKKGKLMKELMTRKLAPVGPMLVVYEVPLGHPSKERPTGQELCMPVSAPAPENSDVQGDFVLKAFASQKVLSVYGLGDYSKQFERLSKSLSKELKARRLKTAGPMIQVFHHDPSSVATKDLVSELLVPVK